MSACVLTASISAPTLMTNLFAVLSMRCYSFVKEDREEPNGIYNYLPAFFSAILSLFALACESAQMEIMTPPGFDGRSLILIKGDIALGDGDKFERIASTHPRALVALNSMGGLVQEALRMGANIRMSDMATMVLPGESCYSSCALVWVSGARRYMNDDSIIGFHAAYIYKNGVPSETGMGNAEIGSFLTHLGLGIEAIRFMTQAPPEKVNFLTMSRAKALGIEVRKQVSYDADSKGPENLSHQSVQSGWMSDWGSGIIAYVFNSPCKVEEFISLGFDKAVISTIPIKRLKSQSQAWFTTGERAVTVVGCWRSSDGIVLSSKLQRKSDHKTWDQEIRLDDGTWEAF